MCAVKYTLPGVLAALASALICASVCSCSQIGLPGADLLSQIVDNGEDDASLDDPDAVEDDAAADDDEFTLEKPADTAPTDEAVPTDTAETQPAEKQEDAPPDEPQEAADAPADDEAPLPSPEQQAAAIAMLQKELDTLRKQQAAEKNAQAQTASQDTQPVPYHKPGYAQPTERPAEPWSPARARGLREPALPKLLPMDVDGKIFSTDTL